MIEHYSTAAWWALDMVRALHERPLWAKWMLRIVMGRYAYREFIGLVDCMHENKMLPDLTYELEHIDYHKDVVRKDWWRKP